MAESLECASESLFRMAVRNGDVARAERIIKRTHIDLEKLDGGRTYLATSIVNRDIAMTRFLLSNVADKDAERSLPPLMYAVFEADIPSINLLVSSGANVNAVCSWGETALSIAILFENVKVISILLESGADPEAECKYKDKVKRWLSENAKLYPEVNDAYLRQRARKLNLRIVK
jgi:ankyrin repeat protein